MNKPSALGIIIALITCFAAISCTKTETTETQHSSAINDLSTHPLYSTYDFGAKDNIIDLGSQPLGVPIGVISELMNRDNILKESLSTLGLKLRSHPFFKGGDINYFLKNGKLDIALAGDMPMIAAAATGKVIVLSLAKQQFSSLIARDSIPVNELKGKKIGNAFGSSAHYSLLLALASADMTEKDVTLVKMKVSEMPDALANGNIDAFVAWEPTPTIALTKYKDFNVIHRSINTSYLYVTKDFAERHPRAAQLIAAAQIRAMRWMDESEENLLKASELQLKTSQKFSGYPPVLKTATNAALIKNGLSAITAAPFIPEEYYKENGRLHREFIFIENLGKLPEESTWENAHRSFDRNILIQIMKDPAGFRINEYDYNLI
ncbi:MAG: NrtA/SsuA/CpmA family ABC transporter substrate-binding protein [Nitrospira sp.]|nr:NrtA/SsuA/CpmA family ABC transporter substrate-binding protein [bacterium]MBL7047927.1 NrtA/SsuA/CpmA family ABC transporter substrate-binding protein [Nitrospira sp.]